ncbi:MAG: hypothetical protein FJW32_24230 [Acidobacteria bacterium]|nr:hypothetical protein [Acidobacteriota bacterium]
MLTREVIVEALTKLSDELARRGIIGEIDIVDGTAMVLAFSARLSTKDVDAIFEPASEVRAAAARIALELNLDNDWLNDAAKGFLSSNGTFQPVADLDLPNLRVLAPTAEYMLAMKVLAARAGRGEERGDAGDIRFLIQRLGLTTTDSVLEIVQRYYDPTRLLPRNVFTVDSIIEELKA